MFTKEDIFKESVVALNRKIAEWEGEKILLYGAGEHSDFLLKDISWGQSEFLGFVDKSPDRQRNGFLGYSVIAPEKIVDTDATKIVISSFSFQEEIYQYLLAMKLEKVELVRLYSDESLLKFIKKHYACCPEREFECTGSVVDTIDKYILPYDRDASLKILLLQLPFPVANHRHKRILPMNLLYLASSVRREQPDAVIRILDGQVYNLTLSEMKELLADDDWDIIGIGYWTGQAIGAWEVSEFIKKEKKTLLIHGGVHPTLCPEESVEYCDFAVLYEGEQTFSEIVRCYNEPEKIALLDGVAYKKDNQVVVNPPVAILKDLDEVPFPAFDLITDLTVYNSPMHVTGGLRVPLIGSRGCPYACTFCSSPLIWKKKVRWRDPKKVVDEMAFVMERFNITQFHFWDDNLLLKRDYMKEICEEILSRNLKMHWCGLTRATHINKNKDLLPIMKESGCVGIEIGIESFTEESIAIVKKEEGVSEMREAAKAMEEVAIAPLYTHMLFNPGETISGYRQKQLFLDEVNKKNSKYLADSRLGQGSTPHRTTEFEREAKRQGEVFVTDNNSYVHHRINFIPYSLLQDVPDKIAVTQENPLRFLEIILQAIFDWDSEMIDTYIKVYRSLWDRIDGKKTVVELCDEIGNDMNLDNYKKKVLVALSVVSMSRGGSISGG